MSRISDASVRHHSGAFRATRLGSNSIKSMAASEKLIQTVYAFPVLYNVSLHDYRSTERRVKAWREVAASVGLSGQYARVTLCHTAPSV